MKRFAALLAAALLLTAVGCSKSPANDTTDQNDANNGQNSVREDVDRVGDDIRDGVEDAGNAVRDGADAVGDAVTGNDGMGTTEPGAGGGMSGNAVTDSGTAAVNP